MNETIVDAGRFAGSSFKENLILIWALVVLILSYVSAVGNTYLPAEWAVGCCGKAFWWSPVGCSAVLVACSLLLRLRRTQAYLVVILMSLYALGYSSYAAFQRWIEYSPVDKGYALQQALLPLYRPLSILLGVFVFAVATRSLVHFFSRRRS